MSAHGTATQVKYALTGTGGDGLKCVMFTFTGSASYDAGGSVLDVSGLFGGYCYMIQVAAGANDYVCNFVPGTSYATTDCLIRIDDVSGGAEASGSLAGVTFYAIAWGTDTTAI